MSFNIKELKDKRSNLNDELEAIENTVESEQRDFTDEERNNYDSKLSEIEQVNEDIERAERAKKVKVKDGSEKESTTPGRESNEEIRAISSEMNEKEKRSYSLMNGIRSITDGHGVSGLEKEVSDEIAKRTGREPEGFYFATAETRDVDTSTGSGGIQDSVLADNFIDQLKNQSLVTRFGATVLDGLQGDISLPKKTSSGSADWTSEGSNASESTPNIGQVQMSPERLAAFTQLTKQFIRQSSVSAEQFVRNDLSQEIAIKLDDTVLHGSGTAPEPSGLTDQLTANDSGVDVDYTKVVDLIKSVKSNTADSGEIGFMTNATGWKNLVTTDVGSDTGQFIADASNNTVLGRPLGVTEQVNEDQGTGNDEWELFYGNWAEVMIGMWGALDVMVNPYANARAGLVDIVAAQLADVNFRHTESFAFSHFNP